MERLRFLCISLLVVLVFTIATQAAENAQQPPASAGQSAAQSVQVQNDAAHLAGTPTPAGVGTVSTAPPETGTHPPALTPPPELEIGAGDLLSVMVYGVPELSQDVRVGNEGEVYLPLVGHVQLAGLTADQAQTVVENRLREGGFVTDPHVSILMKEYINAAASVTGEVQHPGAYPILGTRRLLDVLAAAGGVTSRAGRTVFITHRDDPDHPTKTLIPTDPVQSPESNVTILPGDTVVVAKAGIVYVVGEVGRPSGLIMENNESMTVLQAIALAGGTSPVAALNGSRLIRKTDKGREELPLPLKKILANKAPDLALKADDIIFVPGSAAKKAGRRGVESILTITTALAVYRP